MRIAADAVFKALAGPTRQAIVERPAGGGPSGRLLGAVIAGGGSRRFGSDKAVALLDGRPLLAHALDALAAQTDALVICGREVAGCQWLPDHPRSGLGPLGGVAAALRYAAAHGFEAVVTSACDTPRLPGDLVERLAGPGPAVVAGQPLIGYWPVGLAASLDRHLQDSADLSMFAWVEASEARLVPFGEDIVNINRPADLHALAASIVL